MTSVKFQDEIRFSWQRVAKYGFISGVAVLYVCLVGMVEAFDQRDVINDVLSLGWSLLVVIGLGMGYVAANNLKDGKAGKALISGLGTGLISGLMATLLVIIIDQTNIRDMFVNASPALAEILTFSQESLTTGLLMLVALLTGLGLLGAIIDLIPKMPRGALVAGLAAVVLIGMLQELLEVILKRSDVTEPIADFLFGQSGLSITGAITIFVIFAILNVAWRTQNQRVQQRVDRLPAAQHQVFNRVMLALVLIFLILLPQLVGPYISQILVLVGLYALMGLGLNIEIGLAGLLDLGFVGFFAIGAYTVALFTSTSEVGLSSVLAGEPTGESFTSFWVAIPFAIGVAALAGVLLGIPVLRMRGDYLAIVTLGLAEIIRILVLSDFLRPILGGAQGILQIPKPVIPGIDFIVKDPQHFYYLIFIGCIIIAFGIGAAFAGLSGAIFAAQVGSVFPHSFGLIVSINVVSLVIIGGVGSIPGVILGSLVLVGMPELLREFAEFRLLIYGALLVVMMLVKPEGLWPSEVTKRELATDDEEFELAPGSSSPATSSPT